MKKISVYSLLFLFFIGGGKSAWSQSGDYPISYNGALTGSAPSTRRVTAVSLSDDLRISVSGQNSYNDKSAEELVVLAGSQLTPGITMNGGNWMHGYVYIDTNNDGQFSPCDVTDAANEDYSIPTGSELFAFSYYNVNDKEGVDRGWSSQGEISSRDPGTTPPAFNAPATPGVYRIRFKTDWNSLLPEGGDQFKSATGVAVDATLRVHGANVNVAYLESGFATVTGGASITYGQAFDVTVNVKEGQAVKHLYIKHGYKLDGPQVLHGVQQWQEEVVDFVLASGSGTYTVPAEYVNGDLQIEAVGELVDVTYTYKVNNVTAEDGNALTFTKTVSQAVGIPLAIPEVASWYTCEPVQGTVEGNGQNVEVTCTANYPFSVTTLNNGSFAENTPWYTLQVVENSRDVYYNGSDAKTIPNRRKLNKASLWCFVKEQGSEYGVRLYNFAAGVDKPVGMESDASGAATMGVVSGSGTNVFLLKSHESGFRLQSPTNENCHLGGHAGDGTNNAETGANTSLGYWNDTNSSTTTGSAFKVASVDVMVDGLAFSGCVGGYTGAEEDKVAAAKTYVENPGANTLDALLTACDNYTLPTTFLGFDTGKYYQLVQYGDVNVKGQVVYAEPSHAKGNSQSGYANRDLHIKANPAVPASLIQFEAGTESGEFYIKHSNSGYYFVNTAALADMAGADLPINKSEPYVFEKCGGHEGIWALRSNTTTTKYLHCGTGNGNVIVREQSPEDNTGEQWLIREVTECPVEVGALQWTTLCLPMPVTIPEDETLTAYYVSRVTTDGAMELTEIAGGTNVAAKTPMLLYSTSETLPKTYTFGIAASGDDLSASNKLSGTTARETGFNGSDPEYYVLANLDNVVAFYKSTSTAVPANKAYFLVSKMETASANAPARLNLDFGGGCETGIDTAVSAEKASVVTYYDLSGRRVLYPSHGIFVTSEGKKVFIK